MKYFLLFLIIFNNAFASNDVAFNLKWKLVRNNDISIVWKARNIKNTYASISTTSRTSDINLYKNNVFFKKMLSKKKKMLTFSGVSNWKIKKHKWQKSKNGDIYLIFEGSYKDHQESQVTFIEVHKFSKNKVTQILYSQPKSTKTDLVLKDQLLLKYGVHL